jgi:conjugal transfer/entry exclusion protein
MANNVTKAECMAVNQKIMEKLDSFGQKLEDLAIQLAKLPDNLSQRFDERYAIKSTEDDVYELKEKLENRNYEWLKYIVGLVVGIALAYLGFK